MGPPFLQQTESECRLKTECKIEDLPEQTKAVINIKTDSEAQNPIDINRFSSLIRVTARVLAVCNKEQVSSLKNVIDHPNPSSIEVVTKFWIKDSRRELAKEIKKGDYRETKPSHW